MGIDFRQGSYKRFVKLGKRTVKDGEAVAVWDVNGVHREFRGPKLLRLWWSQVRFLDRRTASPEQYLVVRHKSGAREHVRGPCTMFENPVKHDSIAVADAITLRTEAEAVVIYREVAVGAPAPPLDDDDAAAAPAARGKLEPVYGAAVAASAARAIGDGVRVVRLVVRGPTAFVPEVGDRVHEFAWSASHPPDAGSDLRRFTVVDTGPQTLDVDAPLADGARARLTARFRVAEVDTLLASGCADPVADLRAALEADLAALELAAHDAAAAARDTEEDETKSDADDDGARERGRRGGVGNAPCARALAAAIGAPHALVAFGTRSRALGVELLGPPQVRAVAPSAAAAARAERDARARAAADDARAKDDARAAADAAARSRQRAEVAAALESAQAERELEAAAQTHALSLEAARADAERARARARDDDALRVLERLRALDVDLTQVLCTKPGAADGGVHDDAPVQQAITRVASALAATPSPAAVSK